MTDHTQPQQCSIDDIQCAICGLINTSGQRRQWFANILGISRQALAVKLRKQTFSIPDIQKVCSALGYHLIIQFKPN